jgi:hypothetical protein
MLETRAFFGTLKIFWPLKPCENAGRQQNSSEEIEELFKQ